MVVHRVEGSFEIKEQDDHTASLNLLIPVLFSNSVKAVKKSRHVHQRFTLLPEAKLGVSLKMISLVPDLIEQDEFD